MLNSRLLINGAAKDSQDSKRVVIKSPTDDREIGTTELASKMQVDEAYKSAKNALNTWTNIPLYEKYQIFKKISDELLQRKDEISKIISDEIAKPLKDSLTEVERSSEFILTVAETARALNNKSNIGDSMKGYQKYQKTSIVEMLPVGVVLCISPFNYPINLSVSKIAPALIGGNTVVFKPSSQGALSGYILAEIFNKYLPQGVINFVTGSGSEIGDYLITHELVNMINFTGSTEVGKHIKEISKVPYLLELGGKDFAIVSNKANIEKAVEQIIQGAFSYSGQRCTAIKAVLVGSGVYEQFVSMMKQETMKLTVGNPSDNTNITCLISMKAADYAEELANEAIDKGAKASWEPKRDNNLVYPLILEVTDSTSRILWEEQFAPILPIYKVNSLDEAIHLANKSKYGLQADVFTNDINEAFEMARKLEVGTVQINGKSDRGPDNFPFLGVKASGSGTQGIGESIRAMQREKVIVINL
ncbi:MAG: aldehyde dehydrogenase family protein [bacterium]